MAKPKSRASLAHKREMDKQIKWQNKKREEEFLKKQLKINKK